MKSKRLAFLIPLLLLFAIMGARITAQDFFDEISVKVFDTFQRIQPRSYEDARVRFIDIDDKTLEEFGQWPWPRTLVSDLLKGLDEAGVAVSTLDIVFAEPDRTSPKNILKIWSGLSLGETAKGEIKNLPDHDQIFAEAINPINVVTGFVLTPDEHGRKPQKKGGVAYAGENPIDFLPRFEGAVTTLENLEEAAEGNGSFNFLAESDAVIRRIPLVVRYQDSIYPSLVAETLRVAQGASSIIVKSSGASGETSFGEKTGIVSVKIGQVVIPTDAQGRVWLYDAGYQEARTVPAWKVLKREATAEELQDTLVYIGSSAAGLKDLRATPLNPVAAGTEIHVQLSEQIILGEYLIRPDWASGAEMIYLFVLSLILIFLLPRVGALGSALLGLIAIGVVMGFSWYAFTEMRLLFDPVFPSLAALLFYIVVSLMNYLRTESEKKHVRDAFSRYLAPALVEKLAGQPDLLKLGGEAKTMTLLFADIQGFTTISEQFNASELTRFMNRFLTPMTEIIMEHQGTIDKYMGDCIMAFWNAPLEDPNHVDHAVTAALNMRRSLAEWNQEMQLEAKERKEKFFPIRLGIGLNTGSCSVGNMGSDQRFDYSVLGDEVNLASRLEGLCRMYDMDTIIGENTARELENHALLELDLIRVKGKTQPVRIFGLLGGPELAKNNDFTKLVSYQEKFLEAYRAREWDNARATLDLCKTIRLNEIKLGGLYDAYLSRLNSFKENPPSQDWQGVWQAQSK